jgi:hypothetical protein
VTLPPSIFNTSGASSAEDVAFPKKPENHNQTRTIPTTTTTTSKRAATTSSKPRKKEDMEIKREFFTRR